MLYNYNFLKG